MLCICIKKEQSTVLLVPISISAPRSCQGGPTRADPLTAPDIGPQTTLPCFNPLTSHPSTHTVDPSLRTDNGHTTIHSTKALNSHTRPNSIPFICISPHLLTEFHYVHAPLVTISIRFKKKNLHQITRE